MDKYFSKLITWIEENSFSDIYIEPEGSEREFYLVKGKQGVSLQLLEKLSYNIGEKLINFLRIKAKISTYNRIPQEGYFATPSLAFRLTSLPGYFGDVLSLRVIYREPFSQLFSDSRKLKFSSQVLEEFFSDYKLDRAVFFTGKPAQGKTTTLFYVLKRLSQKGYRILSYEEPVEFVLDTILQFNRSYFTGLDVKNIYKYLLRLAPDILVIGELREKDDWDLARKIKEAGIPLFATFHSSSLEDASKLLLKNFGGSARLFFQELTPSGPQFATTFLL